MQWRGLATKSRHRNRIAPLPICILDPSWRITFPSTVSVSERAVARTIGNTILDATSFPGLSCGTLKRVRSVESRPPEASRVSKCQWDRSLPVTWNISAGHSSPTSSLVTASSSSATSRTMRASGRSCKAFAPARRRNDGRAVRAPTGRLLRSAFRGLRSDDEIRLQRAASRRPACCTVTPTSPRWRPEFPRSASTAGWNSNGSSPAP